MIYSPDDVRRMLAQLQADINKDIHDGGRAFFYKNDSLPPKVVMLSHVNECIKKIEESL